MAEHTEEKQLFEFTYIARHADGGERELMKVRACSISTADKFFRETHKGYDLKNTNFSKRPVVVTRLRRA